MDEANLSAPLSCLGDLLRAISNFHTAHHIKLLKLLGLNTLPPMIRAVGDDPSCYPKSWQSLAPGRILQMTNVQSMH